MITLQQVKAARSLLGWGQEDLAKAARMSKPALANFERGAASPRLETLAAIQRALEEAGIEFLQDTGLRLRGEILKTQIWEGSNSLIRLLEDILETLAPTKGELLVAGVSEADHLAQGGEQFLEQIRKRGEYGIATKLLACEGDRNFVDADSPLREYRWVSREIFSQIPYYIYGDKYAMLLFGKPQKVVMIENRSIAESYRAQFTTLWNSAALPK